jgi:hypothetical protein
MLVLTGMQIQTDLTSANATTQRQTT